MIRLFVALPVPYEIGEALTRRQQGLPRARWRSTDDFHITLRFFGEVQETLAADLDSALAAISASPFEVQLEGVGSFGEGAHVSSVHALATPSEPLTRLAARCETAARKVGLKPDTRSYKPHVTLAYLKGTPPERVAAWIQGHNLLKSPSWRADRFGLYSSWLSEDGSRYELEREYRLI